MGRLGRHVGLLHSTRHKKGIELDIKKFSKDMTLDIMCDSGLDIALGKLAAKGVSGSTGNLKLWFGC